MTSRRKPKVALSPYVYDDIKKLPGNIRGSIIIAIDELEINLRPGNSKQLTIEGETREIRRLRLGKWRIIYAIIDGNPIILGVRKRPPYNYRDLSKLIDDID